MPRPTPHTITGVGAYLQEIAQGVAFARQEALVGVSSMAVLVRRNDGQIVAGLVVLPPAQFAADEAFARLLPPLREIGGSATGPPVVIGARQGQLGGQAMPLGMPSMLLKTAGRRKHLGGGLEHEVAVRVQAAVLLGEGPRGRRLPRPPAGISPSPRKRQTGSRYTSPSRGGREWRSP